MNNIDMQILIDRLNVENEHLRKENDFLREEVLYRLNIMSMNSIPVKQTNISSNPTSRKNPEYTLYNDNPPKNFRCFLNVDYRYKAKDISCEDFRDLLKSNGFCEKYYSKSNAFCYQHHSKNILFRHVTLSNGSMHAKGHIPENMISLYGENINHRKYDDCRYKDGSIRVDDFYVEDLFEIIQNYMMS